MLKIIKSIIVIVILLIGSGLFLLSQENTLNSDISKNEPAINQNSLDLPNNTNENYFIPDDNDNPEFTELITDAEHLYTNGYVDSALSKYLAAYKLNSDSTLPYLGIARIYLDHEKIDLAEKNLLIAKQKGKLSTSAKILITRLNLLKQNYDQAKEVLSSINNPNSETLYLGCILNLLSNNYSESQKILEELIKLDSNDIYKQAGQNLDKAFAIYDTFTDSPHSYLLTLSAQNLIDTNEFAIARPLLLQAINEKNDYRDAWVLLGYSYLQSNLLQDAEQSFKKAKQIDPYFGTTYFYLGLSKEALNQNEAAIDYFQQAENFGYTEKQNIYIHLANTYYKTENYPKAADNYLKAIALNALSLDEYTKPIWLFLEPLNNPSKALEIAQDTFTKFPDQAISYNLLGWTQLANNQLSNAKENLEKALNLNPKFEAVYYNLGNLYKLKNNSKVAEAYYEKAVKYAKENENRAIQERAEYELQIIQELTQPSSEDSN